MHPYCDYNFIAIYAFFPTNNSSKIFRVDTKIAYSNSAKYEPAIFRILAASKKNYNIIKLINIV